MAVAPSMSTDQALPTGLYGKVPAHGDFVTHGLPADFIKPWDQWLGRWVVHAKDTFDQSFQLIYLTSPVWCFALDPKVAGEQAWVGALATSVDSHQRPFPITLALAVPPNKSAVDLAELCEPLTNDLQELCFAAIDGGVDWDVLVMRLQEIRQKLQASPSNRFDFNDKFGATRARLIRGIHAPPVQALSGLFNRSPQRSSSAIACWWHAGTAERPPEAIRSVGLPPMEAMLGLLSGDWTEQGWATGA